jgi:hypothetical protein
MSLIEINWNPEKKQLCSFGLIALIATALISIILYFVKGVSIYWAAVIFGIGFIIFISSRLSLKLTKLFYLTLTIVTMPIGFVVSFLVLAIFYFLLITPLAFIFCLIGRDLLCRKFDTDINSYWVAHNQTEDFDRYFHQF